MKRMLIPAVLVGAALAVTTFGATGSAKPSQGRTFTVIERDREGQFHFVDNPPRAHRAPFEGGRLSAGDEFVLFQPIRSTKGRRVGSLNAICTAVHAAKNFERALFVCHGGYLFKHGTLDLEALFRPASGVKIGITGGTGVYAGASGTVRSISGKNRSVDTIHLLP